MKTIKKINVDIKVNLKVSLDLGGFRININNTVINQKNARKLHPIIKA